MTMRRISSLIRLMLLSVSIASTATAQDGKTFPGLLCQPETPTEAISRHRRSGGDDECQCHNTGMALSIVRDATRSTLWLGTDRQLNGRILRALFRTKLRNLSRATHRSEHLPA